MSGKEVRINMKRTEIVAKTEELVTPIIEENHFELVDVAVSYTHLDVYKRQDVNKEDILSWIPAAGIKCNYSR